MTEPLTPEPLPAQAMLDHYKETLTDAEVMDAFVHHVQVGRGGWAGPKLQAVLERILARLTPAMPENEALRQLEDMLTVGLVEQPINGSVLSWAEAALIAHRIGRHLLAASPVPADDAYQRGYLEGLNALENVRARAEVERHDPSNARG